ncbi:MAG TPA: SPFH domain-containing protein [Terriglobales bacterium]|jgi:regulator of protease activity HflC (stomatin/prohibitin superfamily)|nr:SPFH domain-containing protein [Terriglobales bacterium]
MLSLKYLLLSAGVAMFVIAAGILTYDAWLLIAWQRKRLHPDPEAGAPGIAPAVRWRTSVALVLLAWAPLVISAGIVIIPSGMAGVRVSQTKGTLAGTLYPGVHFVTPLVERVELFNTRDQLFTTGRNEDGLAKGEAKGEALRVQAKEGLTLGLAITVRYQIDPRHLDYIQANLPQPLEKEIVPPVVATAWRELVPSYTVREVFSARREEVRQRSAEIIRTRLAADGIVVKEVMLRDIELPEEYAKGLESLLLKEQENDRMGVETEIHQKQVKIAEADADATKVQEVKQAEGQAEVRVLQAKSESDAMQYTLPLKEKQIEQSKLEAEARKEATVKNAEAAGEAKLIDSKAEMERRKLLAQAEAERIRLTAAADAERMASEAAILKQNPLLINKIVAERLSDKLQIMMVPSDGKFFFTNDVLRGMGAPNHVSQAEDVEGDGKSQQ